MKLYLSIIGICTAILATLNSIFAEAIGFTVWFAILACVGSVLACIAIDGVVAIIVRAFPQKNYDPNKKMFRESKWECAFYERLGIKKWKDKIPETGKLLVKFGKDKLEHRDNPEYLYRFLTELGYAEIMHWISTLAGFLVIFILPLPYALHIGVPVGIVNFCLQIPPALVQRYNRPRLLRIYNRVQKRAEKPAGQPNVVSNIK